MFQQILQRLEGIQTLMAQTNLSTIPLRVYFYGGQVIYGGFDTYPTVPASEQGGAFTNTLGPLSNGTNMLSAFEGAEMCRLGADLPSSGSLPTTAGNPISIQENGPSNLLKEMYPGVLNEIDFTFSTQTATGNQVVVGDGLAVDAEEGGTYYRPYQGVGDSSALLDDFDTYEFHFIHSYAAAYQNGGITVWDDFQQALWRQ